MSERPVRVVCDQREGRSGVIKALEKFDAEIILQVLDVGDYILSDRVGVERKTDKDAIGSLIGEEPGKIFRQCKDLAENYDCPLLLLECDISDLFVRNVHPAAIWGMLRSILWNGCPLEFTHNAEGTAKKLYELAKAEQTDEKRPLQVHGRKRKPTMAQQQEAVVSSILDVGTATAQGLLRHFGSVQAVFNASAEELDAVPDVGHITAEKIKNVVSSVYFGGK